MKEPKIPHTIRIWESHEKRLQKIYEAEQPTCCLNVFLADLVSLGLRVKEEIACQKENTIIKAKIIPFPGRAI